MKSARTCSSPLRLWEDISPSLEDVARLTLCSADDYGTDNPDLSSPACGSSPGLRAVVRRCCRGRQQQEVALDDGSRDIAELAAVVL